MVCTDVKEDANPIAKGRSPPWTIESHPLDLELVCLARHSLRAVKGLLIHNSVRLYVIVEFKSTGKYKPKAAFF
jgi:hypothetical protein